ncbi:MAG TPA: MBL fold metallo-hydrolase [Planctomycetes bacterium]|nr:MBL fold metallo-hydrolase [Planctomycetota bacterium]HIJ69953.1 MBL fold metallo-hydrolase [Planctomycetota bacterium]
MSVKLSFLGAARNVTGSCFLLETDSCKLLVDCGLYQERQFRERNWNRFAVEPAEIDAVLLTHAHLDHCGLLPKLVKEGFSGRVYCTDATSEIARIVMADSAHIQEEDAEFKRKRHKRKGHVPPRPVKPLYSVEDAQACSELFSPVKYRQVVQVGDSVEARFYDAGHILGSAMIKVKVPIDGQMRSILFSGDVGRNDRPILKDPAVFDEADYILIESTYGDRTHDTLEDTKIKFAEAINSTVKAGGNIIVPSFAIERSQEILYYLNELQLADEIPHILVFLDSPMAVSVTDVFRQHPEMFDAETIELLNEHHSPFSFSGLKMVRSTAESKAINKVKGTIMVIAGSGMCTGGRIKYHLVEHISRPESTILFVGYQAEGTLGRQIVEGAEEVRILGEMREVKARIVQALGFSAHADKNELFRWLSYLKKPPRHVFVVHGETNASHHFSKFLTEKNGWPSSVPTYGSSVTLD